MATTLEQVLSSLNSVYQPQIDSINQQSAALPAQYDAQAKGLAAQQQDAFGSILDGARSRGLGFSGIPLADQAKYTASTYMPALANLQTAQTNQRTSLTDSLNKINQDKYNQGQSIYQYQTTLEEQQRQFDAQQAAQARAAAAASAFSPSYGGSSIMPTSAGNPKSASAIQRKDGGFNYTDAGGRAISAAAYAAAKGVAFRDLLAQAAKAGDKGAQSALGFVGNDYGYDPKKVVNQQLADIYNSLVWGTGKSASYKPAAAAQAPTNALQTAYSALSNPLAGLAR